MILVGKDVWQPPLASKSDVRYNMYKNGARYILEWAFCIFYSVQLAWQPLVKQKTGAFGCLRQMLDIYVHSLAWASFELEQHRRVHGFVTNHNYQVWLVNQGTLPLNASIKLLKKHARFFLILAFLCRLTPSFSEIWDFPRNTTRKSMQKKVLRNYFVCNVVK